MALSINPNHPYKIYVYTQRNNVSKDDKSLESPLITFKCNVKTIYVSEKLDKSIPSSIRNQETWHEFKPYPADDLTEDYIANLFTNSEIIPFSLRNLYWKETVQNREFLPVMSIDDVASSMLDVCKRLRHESGRKKLCLMVFIKKEVIVPHDEYLAMLKAERQQEVLGDVDYMIQLHAWGWNLGQSDWEAMAAEIRQAGIGNSIRDAMRLIREGVSRMSEEQTVKVVPASATSIQELKKVICSKPSGGECSVCMDTMVVDAELTSMPCSHVFHSNCILKWLKTSHTCPVCRFKLPTK